MKLKVQQVFNASVILQKIISENRLVPQKGAYRLARMQDKLLPEFTTIANQRDALIRAYDHKEPGAEVLSVPADKMVEFLGAWSKIAEEEIEVDVEAIPLAQLDLGGTVVGAITTAEMAIFGPLVCE